MRGVRKHASSLAAALMFLVLGFPGTSEAHTWTDWYLGRWAQGNAWSKDYRFTTGFPAGSYRDRVNNAFDTWDALPPGLHFNNLIPDIANFTYTNQGCSTSNRGKNNLHWYNLPGQGFALAHWCVISGEVIFGQIVVDSSGTPWWTSTSTVPTTHYDLWSMISQEVGHVTGFLKGGAPAGHWPETSSTLCPDPGASNWLDRETMCQIVYSGTRVQRSPSTHDAHTFDAAYP